MESMKLSSLTERTHSDYNHPCALKLSAFKEFLLTQDKQRTGQLPLASFVKLARVFGMNTQGKEVRANEVGMVDYEKTLKDMMMITI